MTPRQQQQQQLASPQGEKTPTRVDGDSPRQTTDAAFDKTRGLLTKGSLPSRAKDHARSHIPGSWAAKGAAVGMGAEALQDNRPQRRVSSDCRRYNPQLFQCSLAK